MIIIKTMWGLGNQMFQYALGRKLSIKNQTKLYLDDSSLNSEKDTLRINELNQFNVECCHLKEKNIIFSYNIKEFIQFYFKKWFWKYPYNIIQERNLRDIIYDKIWKYSWRYNFNKDILNTTKNSYLIWFRQSYKYFEDIRNILIKDFSPKEKMNKRNSQLLLTIEKKESISIHIRRGDYKNTYHWCLNKEYYEKAIKHFNKENKNQIFICFSDDIPWCKKNIILENVIYIDRNKKENSYRDMILMSKCKHNIIANSSFSRRWARLNQNPEKKVISPKNPI